MAQISKYFTRSEFECPDCKVCNVNQKLLNKLDLLRISFGRPLNVTSGCRCYAHNLAVGGASDSLHITTITEQCGAADIAINDGPDKYRLLEIAIALPFLGIGIGKGFVHFDIRDQRALWTYPQVSSKLKGT